MNSSYSEGGWLKLLWLTQWLFGFANEVVSIMRRFSWSETFIFWVQFPFHGTNHHSSQGIMNKSAQGRAMWWVQVLMLKKGCETHSELFERRRVHMELLLNHSSLLVRISLDQRLQRKEWLVPHMVEHSRSYHGPKPCTRVRPDTGFGGNCSN